MLDTRGAMRRSKTAPTPQTHEEQCSCPACQGLQCLERPRYFAGQLLTEAELNSEQAYVRAKQRLHNRYLHGWGVVCGLEVVCHECAGWVTIKQGYAIDPCGNDVIVCADHDFDVIDYIRRCRDDRKRRTDCVPIRTPPKQVCDEEETWCIYLSYVEQEARPMTALHSQGSNGCTCGGSCTGKCGCGNSNGKSNIGKSSGNGSSATLLACEPTRIYETYQVGMAKQDDTCSIDWRDLLGSRDSERSPLLQILAGLIENTNFDETLLYKLYECGQVLLGFVQKRFPRRNWARLYPATTVDANLEAGDAPNVSVDDQYAAGLQLFRAVRDLYVQNPLGVRCELIARLNEIDVPAPLRDESNLAYAARLQVGAYAMLSLLIQYMLDCFCQNLLPACPPVAYDDRVGVACVTVRNDVIVRICNFSCRRYAGAFPSLFYWLSALPVIPLLGTAIRTLCCAPDLFRGSQPPGLVGQVARVRPHAQARAGEGGAPAAEGPNYAAAVDAEGAHPDAPLFASDLQKLLSAFDPDFTLRRTLLNDEQALPKLLRSSLGQMISALGRGVLRMDQDTKEMELNQLQSEIKELRAAVEEMRKAGGGG